MRSFGWRRGRLFCGPVSRTGIWRRGGLRRGRRQGIEDAGRRAPIGEARPPYQIGFTKMTKLDEFGHFDIRQRSVLLAVPGEIPDFLASRCVHECASFNPCGREVRALRAVCTTRAPGAVSAVAIRGVVGFRVSQVNWATDRDFPSRRNMTLTFGASRIYRYNPGICTAIPDSDGEEPSERPRAIGRACWSWEPWL
jgi:hypothetical protein